MRDPRLNGNHLRSPRREQYKEARAEMLDAMGSITSEIERKILFRRADPESFMGSTKYGLKAVWTEGVCPLRVGINAIGRAPENDFIICHRAISRRHCVLLVHATGGCEVHDTASRNGTLVNHEPVTRANLYPGDILRLCDFEFMLVTRLQGSAWLAGELALETGHLAATSTSGT
jgi:hypothetical protein